MRPCPARPAGTLPTRNDPQRLRALDLCERVSAGCRPAVLRGNPAERGPLCPAARAWGRGIPVLRPQIPQPHNESVRFNGGKYLGETVTPVVTAHAPVEVTRSSCVRLLDLVPPWDTQPPSELVSAWVLKLPDVM